MKPSIFGYQAPTTLEAAIALLAGDPDAGFIAPPAYAIAHTLLAAWAEGG